MEETGPFRDAMIIFIGLKLGKKSETVALAATHVTSSLTSFLEDTETA